MRAISCIMACGSSTVSAATPTIDDSFSESNYSDDLTLDQFTFGAGQTFTSAGGTLDSAKFYLHKTLAPTGTAVAVLRAITGTSGTDGLPTGAALATSDTFDVTTLTTSPALITFNFTGANRYTLVNATNYTIECRHILSDGTNHVHVGGDSTSPVDDGNSFYETSGGTWAQPGFSIDVCFYVYKV